MTSTLRVNTIQNTNTSTLITQTNVTTITIGFSGQTVNVPTGATLTTGSNTVATTGKAIAISIVFG
jgi:hypothetical protein